MARLIKTFPQILLMGGVLLSPIAYSMSGTARPIAGPAAGPAARQQDQSKKAAKAKHKNDSQLKKELDSQYKKWLDEDVVYIISAEERHAFLQLSTNEEREQFIEAFWQRRNPDPDSAENTFKEEHYRRIAYANEHYASGIPGWKTDRGRIYIMWGPPDEVDAHPTGGNWDRPMDQGGGSTTTYPYEDWRYRYLEGPAWAKTSNWSSSIPRARASIT